MLTIVAIHWPEQNSTFVTAICKEVTNDGPNETVDVYHSSHIEALWEDHQDTTVRHRANQAIERFVQRSKLDSPE